MRIFIVNGHIFDVKETYSKIIKISESENADICNLGYTHIQYKNTIDDMIILNPGVVNYFQDYAVIEINNGNINTNLKNFR